MYRSLRHCFWVCWGLPERFLGVHIGSHVRGHLVGVVCAEARVVAFPQELIVLPVVIHGC